ncbi:MAG: tetratricopeptide repeat protein, partial [Bacteroidales bacterium]|nr:tetratricopeptide repeat protein [Bacteroidales bacterium]
MKTNKTGFMLILTVVCLVLFNTNGFSQQTASQLYEKALYLEEAKGELQQAIDLFQEILTKYPEERQVAAKALLHTGICYERLGLKQARKTYQDVIDRYPEHKDEVIIAKQRVLQMEAYTADLNKQAEQYVKNGNELYSRWEYEEAIQEYKKAIELDPDGLLALNAKYYVGQSQFRDGKYNEALSTFTNLVEENPESNIAPVSELMIDQVEHEMKKNENTGVLNYNMDENTIVDKETGITYRKIKSFVGKNDLIKWTTGGFNLSPDAKFLVSDNIVVPINGDDPFTLVDMDASRTVYSPDMKKAAFYADSAIWTVSVAPETGRSAESPEKLISGDYKWQHNVSWSPDGKKLAFMRCDETTVSDIWTISINDGNLIPITDSKSYKRSPAWSPDGSLIAYNDDGVWLASVSTNEKKQIIKNTMNARPRWLSDGKWLFYAAIGKSFLYSSTAQKNYQFSFPEKQVGDFIGTSPDGDKMLFYKPSYEDKWNLKVVSISGGPSFKPVPGHNIYDARWSADSKLFLTLSEKNQGEYIFESVPLSEGNPLQVLIDVKSEAEPFPVQGSPDLSKLAFWLPGKENTKDLYVVPFSAPKARTTGPARLVFEGWSGGPYNVSFSWSPDGTQIALIHNGDIWIVPVVEGNPIQITNTPESELWVNWSPDGKMIGYIIENGNSRSIYFVPKTGGAPRLIAENVTTGRWFPDNKRACILKNGDINIISLEDGKIL